MGFLMVLEKKVLVYVGLVVVVVSVLLVWIIVLVDGVLCGEDGFVFGLLFLKSIVVFIFIFFVIFGYVYGCVVGMMKIDCDVINVMVKLMFFMGMYIVLVFFVV